MTAKQALLEYVQRLSEEEAAEKLPLLIPPGPEFPPAPPEVLARLQAAIEHSRAGGPRLTTDEVRRRNGLE